MVRAPKRQSSRLKGEAERAKRNKEEGGRMELGSKRGGRSKVHDDEVQKDEIEMELDSVTLLGCVLDERQVQHILASESTQWVGPTDLVQVLLMSYCGCRKMVEDVEVDRADLTTLGRVERPIFVWGPAKLRFVIQLVMVLNRYERRVVEKGCKKGLLWPSLARMEEKLRSKLFAQQRGVVERPMLATVVDRKKEYLASENANQDFQPPFDPVLATLLIGASGNDAPTYTTVLVEQVDFSTLGSVEDPCFVWSLNHCARNLLPVHRLEGIERSQLFRSLKRARS